MSRRRAILAAVIGALVLAAGTTSAQAFRPLLNEEVLHPNPEGPAPPPDGQVEGICGLTLVGGSLYVSEYYRHRVDLFDAFTGTYGGLVPAPNPLDGVCGLAHSSNAVYANEWHESVVRLTPSVSVFDSGHESTGVAVDSAGRVYADDRDFVAVYEPSGSPVLSEGQPLQIGLGSLEDGFGVAVGGGRVYVADAGSQTVKVYEPSVDPFAPVAEIDAGFTSLTDSALAIDPTNGHLLVLDNLQPGFESPEAAIDEFDAVGTFVDQIKHQIVHGEPSGLAFDTTGNLFVSSGNTENSNVIKFGPYSPAAPSFLTAGSQQAATVSAAVASAGGSDSRAYEPRPGNQTPGASASEVVQYGGVRVSFDARLTPKRLPRTSPAGVRLSFGAGIASEDGSVPPQLRGIVVEINRNGQLDRAGLPLCTLAQIQPSTTEGALRECGGALIGEGTFSAKVLLTQQAPFPSSGKVVAFNGTWHGKPAILAHIFGTRPVPTSYTLPFVLDSARRGTFGITLEASLPHFTSKWGYVTGIDLNLGRSFIAHGRRHSYLNAACPAPKDLGRAVYSLARAKLTFESHKPIGQTLTRTCAVR